MRYRRKLVVVESDFYGEPKAVSPDLGMEDKCKVPSSFNSQDWAQEFNNVLVRKGDQPYDEGWLIGWFANAIMRGFDEGRKDYVSIDSVLKVFDNSIDDIPAIRKAIEDMKEELIDDVYGPLKVESPDLGFGENEQMEDSKHGQKT